jgi:hypothetical protein
VTDAGSRAGDEVAQVYVGPGPDHAGIQQAVRSLRGFDRVSLAAGQTRHAVINLDRRSFQYWDETTQQWLSDYGARTISVGDADAVASLPLSGVVTPLTSAAQGTVGGTVPATLALTLGDPASFGAFTPGVDRTYTAATTADVVSTAGDATLSVSGPAHLTNGAFSLADPVGVTFSKSTWSAPVSHDPVTINYSQHIGANEALRTGSYSTTLTFTLSTTTP